MTIESMGPGRPDGQGFRVKRPQPTEVRTRETPQRLSPQQLFPPITIVQAEFERGLKQGVISPDFMDMFKIATPKGTKPYSLASPEQQQFEAYMQSISDRLLGTEFAKEQLLRGKDVPKLRYLIADWGGSINGLIVKQAEPPIIVVTKGLLEKVAKEGSDDVLAGVVAHELVHYFLDSDRNSKGEEGIGYTLPTAMLYYAHYRHTALAEIFKDAEASSNPVEFIHSVMDVHPLPKNAKRIIEDSEAVLAGYLQERTYTQGNPGQITLNPPHKIPKELKLNGLVKKFSYEDQIKKDMQAAGIYKDRPFRGEKANKFSQATKMAKLMSEKMEQWLGLDDPEHVKAPGRLARAARIEKLLSKYFPYFDIDRQYSSRMPEVIMPVLNKLFTLQMPINGNEINNLFSFLPHTKQDWCHDTKGLNNVGRLLPPVPKEYRLLHETQEVFSQMLLAMDARRNISFEDMQRLSQRFIANITSYSKNHQIALEHINFGQVPNMPSIKEVENLASARYQARKNGKPEPEGITPPWDPLIALARKEYDLDHTQHIIADALFVFGITDPRLADIPRDSLSAQGIDDLQYNDLGVPNIFQDSQGKMIGFLDFWADFDHLQVVQPFSVYRASAIALEHDRTIALRALDEAAIANVHHIANPSDLQRIIEDFPLQFAYQNRLMGGALGQDGLPEGSEAAIALTTKLEALAAQDPTVWIPEIQRFFAASSQSRRNDWERPFSTLHDGLRYASSSNHLATPLRDRDFADFTEMGMAREHPYVTFVLQHSEGFAQPGSAIFFTKEQTAAVLETLFTVKTRTLEGEKILPQVVNVDVYLRFIGKDSLATSDADLTERLQAMRQLVPTNWQQYYTRRGEEPRWASKFLRVHAAYELHQYLEAHRHEQISTELFSEAIQLAKEHSDWEGMWASAFRDRIEEQFLLRAERDVLRSDLHPLDLAKAYTIFENNEFFKRHPEFRWTETHGYDGLIAQKITALETQKDSKTIREFAETILFGCKVKDPELEGKLIEAWAVALRQIYGIDTTAAFAKSDRQSVFHREVVAAAENIMKRLDTNSSIPFRKMIMAMADALETQSDLTTILFSQLEQRLKAALLDATSGYKGPLAESGLEEITKDQEVRSGTIDFLLTEASDETLERFINILDTKLQRERKKQQNSIIGKRFVSVVEGDLHRFLGGVGSRQVDLSNRDTRERAKGRLIVLHKAYWNSPFEVRAYELNLLAFPENGLNISIFTKRRFGKRKFDEQATRQERQKVFAGLANEIFARVLPYNKHESRTSTFNTYTTFGRDLITSYLEDTTEAEQRLLLSALATSAQAIGEKKQDETQIGKALAFTLMNMGPAGVKVAQAVHSYPDLPEEIRRGMEGVKGLANPPSRNEIFQRIAAIAATGPQEMGQHRLMQIEHIGSLLGSGAYQYTVGATLGNNASGQQQVALTILRPHAKTFAANEFVHLQHTLASFFERRRNAGDTITEDTIGGMRHVLDQARNMSLLETNYDKGVEQAEHIRSQYAGLAVQVGGRKIGFATVDWLDHYTKTVKGDIETDTMAYKIASLAPGESFNHFAQTHNSEETKALATALEYAEDLMMLSGQYFDHDRHGENFNVAVVQERMQVGDAMLEPGDLFVTHYDFGAVNNTPPSKEEKIQFGEILASVLQERITKEGGGEVRALLVEHLTRAISQQKKGEGTEFLSSVLRGMLARGDFLRFLDEGNLQQAILTVFASGLVDPVIYDSLFGKLNNVTNGKSSSSLEITQFLQLLASGSGMQMISAPRNFRQT